MNYKDFTLGDWIGHISGVIEDESELDGNEMRNLVEFLSRLPKWISVSERLPEDSGTYLITLKNREICLCDIDPEDFGNRAELNITAIAWMPFKPYTAESEEQE